MSRKVNESEETPRKASQLDALSTAALEELLRRDFSVSERSGPDMAVVSAVMEVMHDREEADIPEPDVEEAWQSFRARLQEETEPMAPQAEEQPPQAAPVFPGRQKTPQKRKNLRRLAVAAALVALLVGVLSVPAWGNPVIEELAHWTSQHFSFLAPNQTEPTEEARMLYEQLDEIVSPWTDLPVLPQWYPEGSALERVEKSETEESKQIVAAFLWHGEEYVLSVEVHSALPAHFGEYEKNSGPVTRYQTGGVTHYLMKNVDRNMAVWRNETVEAYLHGTFSEELLKKMLDSIYWEE